MYSFIEGTVISKQDNILVLENNGIGYELNSSLSALSNLIIGEKAKVYTYLQVSENGIALYGFYTLEEKNMFLKLITVSGVGPKASISILSNINISQLSVAIAKQDLSLLSTVKGIGKKTAERILVELKDKVTVIGGTDTTPANITDNAAIEEACSALISLGVNKNEALTLARANYKEGFSAEDIIAKSLRNLGN